MFQQLDNTVLSDFTENDRFYVNFVVGKGLKALEKGALRQFETSCLDRKTFSGFYDLLLSS